MRRIVLFGLTVVVGAACLGLAGWQLRRHSTRRTANRIAVAGRDQPPLVGDSLRTPSLLANRRALLHGTLDEEREFVLRGHLVQGVPAVQVVTPFRLAGSDTAILINRGYVPAPDAVDPGSAAWSESASHHFSGVLLPLPDRGDGAPIVAHEKETWHRLDLAAMRARLPYPLSPLYLVAETDSVEGAAHTVRGKSYPFRAEPPPMDGGPHLMYAVQWVGIAAAVIGFGVVFILRGGRQGPHA